MRKINILFILPKTQQGGAETQMLNLLKYINKTNFSVYLGLLYNNNQLKKEFYNLKNVNIIKFNKKGKFDISTYFKIYRFAKRNNIDIIQTFLGNHHSYIPSLMCNNTLAVGGIRSMFDKEFSFFERITEFTIPKFLTRLNKFILISNSESARDMYIKKGFSPKKIYVIPNGIDQTRFINGNRKKIINELSLNNKIVIGIIARLVKEKNHVALLHCIKIISRENRNIVLLIVGEGPEKSNLETLTSNLQIKNQVIFMGNRKDINDILSAIDIFVFPSKLEGWPNAIGEAMTAGVPVISYPSGDISKIIKNKETGIICKPNEKSLLNSIKHLINKPQERNMLSKNATLFATNEFNVNKMVIKYEQLYSSIIK